MSKESCMGCGREDNLDHVGEDVWCHWCAMHGEHCIEAIAHRQAPVGTRETIITEFKAKNAGLMGHAINAIKTARVGGTV